MARDSSRILLLVSMRNYDRITVFLEIFTTKCELRSGPFSDVETQPKLCISFSRFRCIPMNWISRCTIWEMFTEFMTINRLCARKIFSQRYTQTFINRIRWQQIAATLLVTDCLVPFAAAFCIIRFSRSEMNSVWQCNRFLFAYKSNRTPKATHWSQCGKCVSDKSMLCAFIRQNDGSKP